VRVRAAAALAIGTVFGVLLSWSGMTSPDVIRGALLFRHGYLFLFFASAVAVAAAGDRWLVRRRARALFTGEEIVAGRERPTADHVRGALLFGVGWAIADACPGPIAAQLGQGVVWGLWTLAGVVIGVAVYLRRRRTETEPASDGAVPVSRRTESELTPAR
jgi:uncharacterized membrane protein YedE/YeeE